MLSDNKIAIVSILVAVLLLFSGISAFVTANGEVSEEDEKEGLAENELEGSSAKEDVERPNSIKDRETNSGPDRNKQVPSDVSPYRKESIQNRGKSYLDKELAKEGYIKQKEREATGSSHQRFQSSSGRLDSTSSDSRVLYLEKDELKNLHLEKYNKGERGQYILKMKGPTQGRWLDELQRYDVEILNYMNNMEYRVRTLTSNVDEVEKLGFVEDIRIYQPIQKIDKNIEMGKVIVTLDSSTSSSRNSAISGQLLDRGGSSIVIELESKKDLFSLARDNNVLSIDENHVPHLHDETSSEIVGGYWAPDTPYNGPGNYANELGYNASSIIVSITDTGIGDGTVGDAGHQDFTGRVIGGVDYSGEGTWHDGHAHGTHCAGLVAGDTYNGRGATYANTSYLVGQGVAPEARLFSQKIFDDGSGFGSPDFDTLFKDADDNGVYVHSNSWGGSTSGDYISYDRIYDTKVRDADINEGGDQPMVITVSAGNSGSDSQTTGSPGNAKNVITVGAAENYHPDLDSYGNDYLTSSNADNPDEIADFSSRGPTEDDRIKPDVVASGRGILSTRSPDGSSTLYGEYTQDSNYLWCSGTSMSNPVVAGTASVVVDWYNSTYGTKPSPAMVKSLLVNTAQDLNDTTGNTAHIPNYDEGWGRAYLPPIVDPPVNTIVEDQENLLETGDQVAYPMQYDDPDHPLNISLVWTDAPSDSSNDVHLMNDLEVSVIDPKGKKWHGNAFQNGMSVAETPSGWDYDGDNTDDRNNVVNIFIPEEKLVSGLYTVVVKAENIAMDGVPETAAVDQDYALTIYNGEEFQGDTPSISVYRPTNGDTWASNSVEPIKWVTGGGNGTLTVDLEYSVDNGTTWNAISSGLADTGIYNWTVAYEDSTECRIRATVTDSETDTNTSLSGKFEITPVLIDVLTPDGGEVWFGNTTKTITWNTTGGTDPKTVDLWYSLNNGSTWNSIASGLTDNGSYTWSIPNNESNEALVKAQVVDGASDSYVDLSEDTFRILALKESPWFDDMESGMGSWYPEDTSNTVWELGDPSGGVGPAEAYSPNNSWGTNLLTEYDNDADTSLTTPPVNLSFGINQLEFQTWYDIESGWDAGWVEVGINGTWTKIYPSEGPSYESTSVGDGYSGDSGGWVESEFDLTNYSGQIIQVRFRFASDGSVRYPGWYIDDVYIGSPPPYECELTPDYQMNYSDPGTTVDHVLTVNNTGSENDTYDLTATNNTWAVDFFDMNDNSINSISVTAGNSSQFIARVSVPGGANPAEYDVANITAISQGNTSKSETVKIRTGVPFTTPWLDDFETGTFGGSTGYNWTTTDSTMSGVGTHTSRSGQYSMYTAGGEVTVESWPVNTSGLTSTEVRCWIRRGDDSFSENPDTGEDLEVYYKNETGSWVFIESFAGDGTPGEIYNRIYALPADAVHPDFQLRFVQTGGSGTNMDYWHIDDIYVGSPPPYQCEVTPDYQMDYGDTGTTVDHVLTVNNMGTDDDTYDLTASNNTWSVDFFDTNDNSINSISVTAGNSSQFIARVSIPPGANPGDYDIADITATSQNNASVSDTASLRTEVLAPILVVDDDNGLNTEDWYIDALNNNGYNYNYWDHSAQGTPSSSQLQQFNITIWFTGNSYGGNYESLDSSDRDALGTYMENGGRLYFSSNLGGFDATNYGWSNWYNTYLHSSYENLHMIQPTNMTEISGDPISDNLNLTVYDGDYDTDLWPYTDMVSPVNQGEVSYFNMTNSFNSTIKADTGTYRMVYTSFDFAGVKGQGNRTTLMYRIIEWLNQTPTGNNPPAAPMNPSPADGATNVSTSPTLSVDVSDPDGDPMNVSFYDASDDSLIGQNTGVTNGTTSVTWSGLSEGSTYSWYTIADDGSTSTTSSTWSFTTNTTTITPIRINSNADFDPAHGVTGGSGTPSDPWIIEGHNIDGSGYGYCIYIGNTTDHFVVKDCDLYNANGNGDYYFWNSSLVLYSVTNGTITSINATQSEDDGSLWVNVSSSSIRNSNLSYNGFNGLTLSRSANNEVFNNRLYNNSYHGIQLYSDSDNNSVSNNVAKNSQNYQGISVWGSDNNLIDYNTFTHNNNNGIYLTNSTDNELVGNNCSDNLNFHGISLGTYIGPNHRTTINNNILESNDLEGLYIESADNNTITRNSISSNNNHGLYLFNTTGSVIYYNEFINNPKHVYSPDHSSYNCTWNNSDGEGNYWDDYSGVDDGSNNRTAGDGIGDTQIPHPETDQGDGYYRLDNYPLMDPGQITANTPPDAPTDPSPSDGATGVSTSPTLSVYVSDPDGDSMNVSFYNAAGTVHIGSVHGVGNGTVSVTWSGLSSGTTYNWYATADDGMANVSSSVWSFTTNYAPDPPTDPSPPDNATGVSTSPTLSVNVTDPDGDTMDVSFYDASDDSLIGTDNGVADGSRASVVWNGLSENTTYDWYAVAEDDTGSTNSTIWNFTTGQDDHPPHVVSHSPTGTSVSVTTDIVIEFNETMNTTSVEENFTYSGGGSTWDITDGTASWSGTDTTLTFSPSGDLPEDTTITVEVFGEDINGNQLDGNQDEMAGDSHTWDFTTESLNDPPKVPTGPVPSDGATEVSVSVDLEVNVIDPDGDSMDVTFYNASDDSEIGTDDGVANDSTASVTWSGLNDLTDYSWYAIVSDGETETQSQTWTFTTEDTTPPYVENTGPADGAQNVSIGTSITVTFSESMDLQSVEDNLTISLDVNGTVMWNNDMTVLTYQLDEDMEYETTYQVMIGTDASDENGVSMDSDHTFSFTTEQEPDYAPDLQIHTPSDGDQYERGTEIEINWTASDDNPLPNGPITIRVTYGDGWTTLRDSLDNTGMYTWTPDVVSAQARVNIVVTDSAGQVANKTTGEFTIEDTIPPDVEDTSPEDNESDVETSSNITIELDEPVDPDSVECIVTSDGEEVEGECILADDNRTIIFHPTEDLNLGAEYTVSISAEDRYGNSFNHEYDFETEEEPASDGDILDYWWIILILVAAIIIGLIIYSGQKKTEDQYRPPEEPPAQEPRPQEEQFGEEGAQEPFAEESVEEIEEPADEPPRVE